MMDVLPEQHKDVAGFLTHHRDQELIFFSELDPEGNSVFDVAVATGNWKAVVYALMEKKVSASWVVPAESTAGFLAYCMTTSNDAPRFPLHYTGKEAWFLDDFSEVMKDHMFHDGHFFPEVFYFFSQQLDRGVLKFEELDRLQFLRHDDVRTLLFYTAEKTGMKDECCEELSRRFDLVLLGEDEVAQMTLLHSLYDVTQHEYTIDVYSNETRWSWIHQHTQRSVEVMTLRGRNEIFPELDGLGQISSNDYF